LQEPYIQVCVHTDVKGKQALYQFCGEATIARVLVCATGRLDYIAAGEVLDVVLLSKYRELS
jgi:hypothetical protein